MKNLKTAVMLFVALTVLTGVLYPGVVTLLAQTIFPKEAAGSLIAKADGAPAGSSLIGQPFADPRHFWGRPSATADFPYNSLASGGSNLGPTNPELIKQVEARIKSMRETGVEGPIPADLVTTSASGLDPHISPAAAAAQIPRIARVRQIDEAKVRRLVQKHTEGRLWGFLGAERVNVLKLNLELDEQ